MPSIAELWEVAAGALAAAGMPVERGDGTSGGRFRPRRGSSGFGRIRFDEAWASLEAPLPAACRSWPDWRFLEINAHLPALCKIGARGDDERHLLVDIPAEDSAVFATQCRSGAFDLRDSLRLLEEPAFSEAQSADRREGSKEPRSEGNSANPQSPSPIADLIPLLREAGWVCREGRHDGLRVELACPGGSKLATVSARGDGSVRFAVPIASRWRPDDRSRRSAGEYLMRLSGRRRLAVPVVESNGPESAELRLEVRLRDPLDAVVVDHALAVLSFTVLPASIELALVGPVDTEALGRTTPRSCG